MYKGYKGWDLGRFLEQEKDHYWKNDDQMKKNRPRCRAKCRDGHSCRAKAVVDKLTDKPVNGRCRMHGGLSTGAKTSEGKERARQAASRGMKAYWIKKRNNF